MQRTVKDLVNSISEKFQINPMRVTQVMHIDSRGLQIVVDEDVVRELPEGQDMIVEFASTQNDHLVKDELMHSPSAEVIVDNELGIFDTAVSDQSEMWLSYTRSPKTKGVISSVTVKSNSYRVGEIPRPHPRIYHQD